MAIRKRTNKEGKVTGWQVTVEGVRGPNGERKRFSKTLPTQREAKEAEREMLNQLATGGIQRTTPVTTAAWMSTWLDVHKPNIEATTRAGYEEKIRNYIVPAMGHIPINHIDGTFVQSWVKDMSDRGLSARTIKNAHQCLYSAMKTAVQLRMLQHNPCQYTILPKILEYNAGVYTDPEIQTAINAAKGTDAFLLVFLGLAIGLRRGELCALKWQHIDLANRQIHITENRVSVKGNVITKQPKSKSSNRTITIGSNVCKILQTAKEEYEVKRNAYGPGFSKEEYVIHLKDGSPYHPDSLTQKWDRFMAKHGLKHIRLHDLRHSCATSMVANNVDTKTVQKRLGHSSYKTTMDLYVHRTQSMDDHAAEIMDKVICKE